MKQFEKWRNILIVSLVVTLFSLIMTFQRAHWVYTVLFLICIILCSVSFIGLWVSIYRHGIKTEVDISRVLGKDAKDALQFGNIGILTYNDQYVCTWTSPFFSQRGIDIVNKKLTSWIESIRSLFEEDVDSIVGQYENCVYEITRKRDSQILYIKDITELYNLRKKFANSEVVLGLMQLDNYMEYQSYENEELMAQINTHLRSPLITWAKENDMVIRRLRSDRFMLVLSQQSLRQARAQNFSILQIIRDEAKKLDVSITLSMAFAYGTSSYSTLDSMVNELIELAQSRGGDQVAIRAASDTVQFVGGNSENGSTRSKVRVRIMAQSIQETIQESERVFIAGHIMSDFDCMGAALSMSNWVKSLKKEAYIVLKDVTRDAQLQETMDFYASVLQERHTFITPEEAGDKIDSNKDLLIMVDHGVPAISSARDFIDECSRILVIDHHRRGDSFVKHAMLTYIESTASSSNELIVELLQSIPNHIPIYEAEATIMYLGILVDTNRFKMHTDARTFEAAAVLRAWGANSKLAEKALCEDYEYFTLKNSLLQMAEPYMDHFMIICTDRHLEKTTMAQLSESLLMVRGCTASFTIANVVGKDGVSAISARSDGTYNVQKIMEKLNGGGHFSAAATERKDVHPLQLKKMLLALIEEDKK